MSEKSRSIRNRTVAVVTALGLGLIGTSCSGASSSSSHESPVVPVQPQPTIPTNVTPEAIQGIEPGDVYTGKVSVLVPNSHTNKEFKYKPRTKNTAQDLVLIYTPKMSRIIMNHMGLGEYSNEDTGFLLTSFKGGILASSVLFNPKTEVVQAIDPHSPIPSGEHELYNQSHITPEALGFSLEVEPTQTSTGYGVNVFVSPAQTG